MNANNFLRYFNEFRDLSRNNRRNTSLESLMRVQNPNQ